LLIASLLSGLQQSSADLRFAAEDETRRKFYCAWSLTGMPPASESICAGDTGLKAAGESFSVVK
jgi:hypothetical protein